MITGNNNNQEYVNNDPGRNNLNNSGLYRFDQERDACGVGFIANIDNLASHDIVMQAIQILGNLSHRGATGADPLVGDGAGILTRIPHDFFVNITAEQGFKLPQAGNYGIGQLFISKQNDIIAKTERVISAAAAAEGFKIIGWRDVETDNSALGKSALPDEPVTRQFFIDGSAYNDQEKLEVDLYTLRKVISNNLYQLGIDHNQVYIVSLSCRTITYKGIFLAEKIASYYPDLQSEMFTSSLALVHQRFSTNTLPTWHLAHPYRMIAHNGEINTLRSNVNWMAARQENARSSIYGDSITKLWPISYEGQSDSACFDNALEFLTRGGYSLPHAMAILIPEAWSDNPLISEQRRAFYQYHASLMEPWDGPAVIAFTDGVRIGATLDRNGLRPARYIITDDNNIIMASEAGVLPLADQKARFRWRLQPGKMLLLDLEQKRIIADKEIKRSLSGRNPYRKWLKKAQIVLDNLPPMPPQMPKSPLPILTRQQAFGYTQEDIKTILMPMITTGQEGTGSMGSDIPPAVLSNKPRLLYDYFKQRFAQVTNPAIDPIREELVMSLVSFIGPRPNLFDLKGLSTRKWLEVSQPILTSVDLEKIRSIETIPNHHFRTATINATYSSAKGPEGMLPAVNKMVRQAEEFVLAGYNIIIISDHGLNAKHVAIPALLAVAAVHNHLIRKGLRTSVGLVCETGEAREIHHICALASYGAEAVNPYLAFATIEHMHAALPKSVDKREARLRYVKALNKGLLKVMSKMGISTFQSYCGAQTFDAIGLNKSFIDQFFFGTPTLIEGVGIEAIANATFEQHKIAFNNHRLSANNLEIGGDYAYRIHGEQHVWQPDNVASLQHAVRSNSIDKYREFAAMINDQSHGLQTLRGLLTIKDASGDGRKPLKLEQIESAQSIVKRFSVGAMSFGSISKEAHTTIARAMNELGGRSNTGEGGEEPERFQLLPNGKRNPERSAIKQVASGRFGVSAEYLVNADMIQIKIAQGAKPGEGGQLPGHKVSHQIAKVRYSTPGVGLISPPPHHDIYSIEDIAQLIFDLKNINQHADISVKLVSEAGVGIVAAGVTKAKTDHLTISGIDGGTGASPLTSIKNAGCPWEIGLAETHQTLVINKLRSRVCVQVDGGLRTGRDVVIGALLGADEFGFSTAPLIASGCIMMRKCHLNTCPVGIATQDPVLRKKFKGLPEHIINYFFFVAGEVREYMARMGFASVDEMIGQTQMLEQRHDIDHSKANCLDLSRLLHKPEAKNDEAIFNSERQQHELTNVLDRTLIDQCQDAINNGGTARISHDIHNFNRSAGTMLSGVVAKKYGHDGLDDDTIKLNFTGTAGQSFAAFLAKGITINLCGQANDYVGKGLSGGKIIIHPGKNFASAADQNIIVGNTVLYGAISGQCYFNGVAGERFAVRNSGAIAVVEGIGDHGCEYMTGGIIVVIGKTGRNFAAGMSGGIAYVLDEDDDFAARCNMTMVDLEPVKEEDDLLEEFHHHGGDIEWSGRVDISIDMTAHDEDRIIQLLTNHRNYTASLKADQILNNWPAYRGKFVKVMPIEYRRALEEIKRRKNDKSYQDTAIIATSA